MSDAPISSALTLEKFREIVRTASKNSVQPLKVMNEAEAKRMTNDDPFGRVWCVGDEYYGLE